ncbi:NUDIX hydrolase [Paenibacillus sp. LHD-38]|uniref:NUDIX hydrolase n=1 Tax=Paenibacillus sp. LHD-38 TaxID=3072143 RepID=UPI00280E29A5|nr:NUDIX hydrolase [Paenibacillus sp. LHD-38]MDQ8735813.1 NUDIX hydrolase [Paenibacillus sp. LHD-38]
MKEWIGSAAVCINSQKQLLMVQGKDLIEWAIPSGGLEKYETLEECCVREVKEETGYDVEVVKEIFVKNKQTASGIKVKTHYFEVKLIGGQQRIDDPDGIIHNVGWKSLDDVMECKHAYPEDQDFLIKVWSSIES